MNFLKNLFSKSDDEGGGRSGDPVYDAFWSWFLEHQGEFARVLWEYDDVEDKFLKPVLAKLQDVCLGLKVLVGMTGERERIDLTITADGNILALGYAEELVSAAPKILGWKISALKPPAPAEKLPMQIRDLVFDFTTLSFYSNDHEEYPDLVDITIVHRDYNLKNAAEVRTGVFIFLDNLLGELAFVEAVDTFQVTGPMDAEGSLVPILKLKDFLVKREKELATKYQGVRYDTETDGYAALEGRLPGDLPLVATINTMLLRWDRKASHPWIMRVVLDYEGKLANHMPDETTYGLLENLEEAIGIELKDDDGYLNVGRQTGGGKREIFFACRDFRKPVKTMDKLVLSGREGFGITFAIYRDKYWKSFERFRK
jgi:hypothetical protein